MSDDQSAAQTGGLVGLRLAVGLVQGLALYLLYSAFDAKSWPATDGHVFVPLSLLAIFVPLIVIQGAGNLRLTTLVLWTLVSAAVIAGLGWYDVWRAWPVEYTFDHGSYSPGPHIIASAALWLSLIAGLFIAHALISGGDADRRFMATYPTHFDVAWKLGVQIALACAFVAAFWLVLWLGAGLFNLIKLDFFEKLIEHRWFSIPATALATAMSLHVSDVRAGLVRGIRTLILVLLSWLLPLMTLIAAGFLASLVFTGLAPLWATRHATALLLTAAAVLIVLINATFQDGHAERKATTFFALAIRAASLLLLPIVLLAGYALWLRVAQYGWTVDRIWSEACIVVAASYAFGYALGALAPTARMIERWNFATSILILVVLAALLTPLADPARISVASQLDQLRAGTVKPEKFDVAYLRWQGERFGKTALEQLAQSAGNAALKTKAKAQLAAQTRYGFVNQTPDVVQSTIQVFPAGKLLPSNFVASASKPQNNRRGAVSYCLNGGINCTAVLLDFDGDGKDEVLLGYGVTREIFRQEKDGEWHDVASLAVPYGCEPLEAMLRSGKVEWADPEPRTLRDIRFGDVRLEPNTTSYDAACPKPSQVPPPASPSSPR